MTLYFHDYCINFKLQTRAWAGKVGLVRAVAHAFVLSYKTALCGNLRKWSLRSFRDCRNVPWETYCYNKRLCLCLCAFITT